MRDWFTIQLEKGINSRLREFIQANPVLDKTMRTLLTKHVKLSEPNLHRWIEDIQRSAREYSPS